MTPEEWSRRVIELMCSYGGQLDLEKKLAAIFTAAIAAERASARAIIKKATDYARWVIENRACICNKPGHGCGTNNMLIEVARVEELIP